MNAAAACVLAVAISAVATALAPSMPVVAAEPEQPAEIIAVQIRKQGYACQRPQSAERDPEASQPDRAAWVLRCENATYRVKLIPKRAAQVERID